MSERVARHCPLPPPEWRQLKDQGVKLDASASPRSIKRQLEAQRPHPDRKTDVEMREVLESLVLRILTERRTGKRFGEAQEGLCGWYALTDQSNVRALLSEVDISDDGRPVLWVAGSGRFDQPLRLLQAADLLRATHNRLTAEMMRGRGDNGQGEG